MSADTTEQDAANGDELRARYLPVSRKELRRRREAERLLEEEGEAGADSTGEQDVSPEPGPEPEDELLRAVQDIAAAEGDDLADEPVEPSGEEHPETDPPQPEALEDQDEEQEDSGEHTDPEPESEDEPEDEPTTADPVDEDPGEDDVPQVVLPAPPEPVEEPARPEEEFADAEPAEEAPAEEADEPELPPEPAAAEEDTGPVGSSRRARRFLRETESIPPLSPELLAELDATNAEIAVIEDPNKVDPELLKKQQALAAKAMQANQERMHKEHAAAEKERRRRSRERPESQVLTEKMLRDSLEVDPEDIQYFTGQIEPVHAQGAHGLDLNKMIDVTSRQASRRNFLLWVVIVLTVLLLAAIAAGVYFFVI